MERQWRLILDGKRGAPFNMAADEAILRALLDGKSPPTLRLYDWERPSISLGYFQSLDRARIDLEYCRMAGVELVRRPTGGRAVLHGHDITFSAVLHEKHIPDKGLRSVLGSHVWLMTGIVAGLKLVGVQAEIGPAQDDRSQPAESPDVSRASADCFAHIAECDVRTGREKIAGAAQVRRHGALLEQGSIPFALPRVQPDLIFGNIHSDAWPGSCYPADISRTVVEQAVVKGMGQELQIELLPGELDRAELELALMLEREKYSSANWTHRREMARIDMGY